MTTKIIFDITLTIVIIYIFFIYNVEHATDIPYDIQNEIKNVSDKYKDDVKQIKYLYDIAKKIQIENEYLTVSQKQLIIGSGATGPTGATGDIRFADCFASGYISVGSAKITKDGNIYGNNLNLKGSISTIDKSTIADIVTGSIIAEANNNKGDLIELISTQKKDDKWIISNTKSEDINDNKLSFTKKIGNTKDISVLELYDNGDVNIPGNLKVSNLAVNNIYQKRNKAKYIRVGNIMTPSITIPNLNGQSNTITSELAVKDYWSLIEIKVFDHNDINVALGCTAINIQGSPHKPLHIKTNKDLISTVNFPTNIVNGTIFNNNIMHDNLSIGSITGNFTGYFGGTGYHQIEITLKEEVDIYRIELYNRYNYDYDTALYKKYEKAYNDDYSSSIAIANTYDGIPGVGIHISARMNGTIVELINSDKSFVNRRIHTGLWTSVMSKEYIL